MACLLFVFPVMMSTAQCDEFFRLRETENVQGVTPGADHYYRNLIVQDLALDRKVPFSEITIHFDYLVNYGVNKCRPGQIGIKAMPVCVRCAPVFYRDYDVAGAIVPEEADLVFSLVNQRGMEFDSIVFRGIHIESDSGLYTTMNIAVDRPLDHVTVRFEGALFYYNSDSYEKFRDHILKIDEYYAAVAVADSLIKWIDNGFLAEEVSRERLLVRWWELGRLLPAIHPARYSAIRGGNGEDPAGLDSRYQKIRRTHARYRMILDGYAQKAHYGAPGKHLTQSVSEWLDCLDAYYEMSFRSDFRNMEFINKIDRLQFSRQNIQDLRDVYLKETPDGYIGAVSAGRSLFRALMERGSAYETMGNQMRALHYYEAAFSLSSVMGDPAMYRQSKEQACRMKNELVGSLLEISRKAIGKDNPGMAAQYSARAREVSQIDHQSCHNEALILEYERKLFGQMAERAAGLAMAGEYRKALVYLLEMEAMTLKNDLLLLPAGFGQWMSIARQGIYNELISKTRNLLAREEFDEAEVLYRQAMDMRIMGGYTVHRHKDESVVEDGIRQHHYDQFIEEGLQYLERNEADLALYYLNKAWALHDKGLSRPSLFLQGYRREAASQAIGGMLSDAKLKAWAFEFEEARKLTDQIAAMLTEYQIPEEDILYTRYHLLHEEIYAKGCEKAVEQYDRLMLEVFSRREAGDYIGARRMAQEAVDFSMTRLECHIRDEQAWYQKILLEPMAQYQEMDRDLKRKMSGDPDAFLAAYKELQRFYYRNKLLEQGVSLATLYELAVASTDADFLAGMLDYYLHRNDLERALGISKSMRHLGLPSAEYRDAQWQLGKKLAIRDAGASNDQLPWIKMNSYTGGDSWYRRLHWGYKLNFLDRSGYAFRYWSLIWKK